MMAARHRREGFAGQHLVVVPNPVRQSAVGHPLLHGLLVTDAGFFPHAAGHYVERRGGTSTHLLIACLRGAGWVRARDGAQRPMRAGDIVWLEAREPHAYGASEADPWTIAWAHFTGDECAAWRVQLGWMNAPGDVGHLPADRLADLRLDQVYAELERGYAIPQLVAASAALRASFCAAARIWATAAPSRSAAERVATVRDQMREALGQTHRLAELAAAAGLSVPHFSQIFRRQTGHAPIDYLIRQRIQRACRLLDTTDVAVAAVAAAVGYDDPYYFARSFRRVMGCSPRAYRRLIKG